ncbi:hypothetical protein Dimus_021981, partial [Dionaea muscipula]
LAARGLSEERSCHEDDIARVLAALSSQPHRAAGHARLWAMSGCWSRWDAGHEPCSRWSWTDGHV